ncbi:DUF896 domain-containing protein [Cohnella fermenti]|uniref:UPF0291 protein E6C55_24655 n=1 Tax=Cohnella fermenti TaxID=2565925 RepID=A0A4V3WE25_9BACL|nr:DUF896 domain-containing protein [Cohnella fermenti]THF74594.1 DUF896 domain-containing protein [Cohnella fermenti]
MDKLVERINELAHKHKTVGLSEEEQEERAKLRKQYLERFRQAFRQQLDNIEIVDEPPPPSITH